MASEGFDCVPASALVSKACLTTRLPTQPRERVPTSPDTIASAAATAATGTACKEDAAQFAESILFPRNMLPAICQWQAPLNHQSFSHSPQQGQGQTQRRQ